MNFPDWIAECDSLQKTGMLYRELADRFGVPRYTIAGWLHKYRNPNKDWSVLHRIRPEGRCRDVLRGRKEAAARILRRKQPFPAQHAAVIQEYDEGCTSRECGLRAGCSWTWANTILRKYKLNTSARFARKVRDRVKGCPDGRPKS
jgi:hypothetical protein